MTVERQIVWQASVDDDRYECSVYRTGEYEGELVVTEGERVLLKEDVTLSYGAIFGPDVSDVANWQDKALAVIDGGKDA
jgi:hypothetical protein